MPRGRRLGTNPPNRIELYGETVHQTAEQQQQPTPQNPRPIESLGLDWGVLNQYQHEILRSSEYLRSFQRRNQREIESIEGEQQMPRRQFNVGDRVRIKSVERLEAEYGSPDNAEYGFTEEMYRFCGVTCTIRDIEGKRVYLTDWDLPNSSSSRSRSTQRAVDNYSYSTDMIEHIDDVFDVSNLPLYLRCSRCAERYEGVRGAEYNDELCPSCRSRHFILPYHNQFKPRIEFYGAEPTPDNLFLGVELEVDFGGRSDSKVGTIMKLMNKEKDKFFVYCGHDGSLTDGFEIITQPATLEYHKSILDKYDEMFAKLISMGYQSHNTDTCGIHVHFNRDFFHDNEELYITRLLYLVDKFWEQIAIFSRRNKRSMNRYSKKVDCDIKEYIKVYNKSNQHEGHYYSINLANANTIEFRMFKGSLNLLTFECILEFVHNCIMVAKNHTAEEIQHMMFEDILTEKSRNYYETRLNYVRTIEEQEEGQPSSLRESSTSASNSRSRQESPRPLRIPSSPMTATRGASAPVRYETFEFPYENYDIYGGCDESSDDEDDEASEDY